MSCNDELYSPRRCLSLETLEAKLFRARLCSLSHWHVFTTVEDAVKRRLSGKLCSALNDGTKS